MKYFLDDGEKYLKLRFIQVDGDGDTIFAIVPDDEILIDAEDYLLNLSEEMHCSGEEIGQCVERVQSYYRKKHGGVTVIYGYANDDTIRSCFLNDYDENRKENGRHEISIGDVRSMF